MLYLSDHGESLGEYGLFLHGMPYAVAPDVQKHVPMVAWLDGGLLRRGQLSAACLHAGADAPLTHDNLYHTMLGLLDVRSPSYQRPLDAFDGLPPRGAGFEVKNANAFLASASSYLFNSDRIRPFSRGIRPIR